MPATRRDRVAPVARSHRSNRGARIGAPGIALVALALMAYGPTASAYLDPGTGSILLQGLIAGLAMVAAFFGSIRRTLGGWVAKLSGRPQPPLDREDERDR